MPEHSTLTIPEWAVGPGSRADGTATGNGGWTSGMLAGFVTGGAVADGIGVDLRAAPPVGRELLVRRDHEDGGATLVDVVDGVEVTVARAAAAPVTVAVPEAVRALRADSVEQVGPAGFPYAGGAHPFPECVTCGTQRADDPHALRIHCGPVPRVAARDADGATVPVFADAWVPGQGQADGRDPSVASVPACWAALDCPSAAPMADPDRPAVLARIAVALSGERRPRIGEACVLAAWQVRRDGRKAWSVSVLLGASGEVLGRAEALWIELRQP